MWTNLVWFLWLCAVLGVLTVWIPVVVFLSTKLGVLGYLKARDRYCEALKESCDAESTASRSGPGSILIR